METKITKNIEQDVKEKSRYLTSGTVADSSHHRSKGELQHSLSVRDRRILESVLAAGAGVGTEIADLYTKIGLFRSEGVFRIAVAKLISNGLLLRINGTQVTVPDAEWINQVLSREAEFYDEFSEEDIQDAIGSVSSKYDDDFELGQEYA